MTFRKMRRSAQGLSTLECEDILKRQSHGVLAVTGDGGYPYAVPLSYVYVDGAIYFHCAKVGHKLDAIVADARASFCVVDKDEVVPETYTTHYRSVIVFGHAHIVEDDAQKREAIRALGRKYSPESTTEALEDEIERHYPALCVVELVPEHMSGKQARELG